MMDTARIREGIRKMRYLFQSISISGDPLEHLFRSY